MKTLIALLALIIISTAALSQIPESNQLTKIETRDGNVYVGLVLEEDDETLILETETLGKISIGKEVIVKRSQIDISKLVGGKLWDDNPQSSRYLWTPNGYGLKKGEGYYQNIWVLYNQVSYGFSDYFSMSAGIVPVFLIGAGILGPVWIVPKFSIPIEKEIINMSAGAFIGTVYGSGFGIVFSTVTLGNRNSNINFGLGWGFAEGEWAESPIINISGMHRVSARGYLLTENYYVPLFGENIVLLSGGYRYMARKIGIDFGLYIPIFSDMDVFIALPMLGVTIPFGN